MSDPAIPTAVKPPENATPATVRRMLDNWLLDVMSERFVGKDHRKTRDRFEAEVRAVADELAGPTPTPIEATLSLTAAVCWAELRYLWGCEQSGKDRTIAQADLSQRRLDKAHARYVRTLKALATVRRLAVPTLQVNVAHQQVVSNARPA
ncbi:hypothetical protein AB1L88_17825 [Tautonia sp. JC769]|uniref:hypothetical protein n=1 Tax=Tautonia sp. JC769 TaxID=3232135 RepID=UPI00345ABAFF